MALENYLKYIKEIENNFELSSPIDLDSNLSCSIVFGETEPIIVRISYDAEQDSIKIDSLLSLSLPSSSMGVQSMMNQLVGDLLSNDTSLGRLIADPDNNSIYLSKEVTMNEIQDNSFISTFNGFLDHAKLWKEKLNNTLKGQKPNQLQEVISFETI